MEKPSEFSKFDDVVKRILSVPRKELLRQPKANAPEFHICRCHPRRGIQ